MMLRSQAREQGLATMLFCVVAVFFFCNLLALVVNILEVGDSAIHVNTIKEASDTYRLFLHSKVSHTKRTVYWQTLN